MKIYVLGVGYNLQIQLHEVIYKEGKMKIHVNASTGGVKSLALNGVVTPRWMSTVQRANFSFLWAMMKKFIKLTSPTQFAKL